MARRDSDTDRRAGRKLRETMALRMTEDNSAAVEARAERRGINASQAARELLELGSVFDAMEGIGTVITRRAQQFLGEGQAAVQFGRGATGDEISHLLAIDAIDEHQAEGLARGAALIHVPEDLP